MFLSILIPSKREEGLQSFLNTFYANTSRYEDIEIIVLKDDDEHPEYVDYFRNVTTIHQPSREPVHVGDMLHECYKLAKGDWVMFCNDDIVIDTLDWDRILRAKVAEFPDEVALFWPDDGLFKSNLSCFPIVSRKVLEAIQFFPTPYRRYKIDDTLYHLFPFNRRIYLPELKFHHRNANYRTVAGNYIEDTDGAVAHDNMEWNNQAEKREWVRPFFVPYRKQIKVMIGASVGEVPRRSDFYDYLNILERPAGTVQMFSHDRSPAAARNEIIEQAIINECTHVLLVDDDHAFRPNSLMKLLENSDADIVSGLYLQRVHPHRPLIFDLANEDRSCRYYTLNGNKQRLLPIVAAGFGFCLMRTDIFQKLEKPYVRLGEINPAEWCDDIGFFNRARVAGIKAYCDMECKIGHMGQMIIWPNEENGKWFAGYDTGTGMVNVPLGGQNG